MIRRLVPIAGAVAALILVVGWGLRLGVWTGDVDLQIYRAAGRAWLDGDELYGILPGLATPLPFTYPPTAAVLFAPLAAIPLGAARAVLFGVSMLALIGTCLLVLNRLRPAAAREHRVAATGAVTAAAVMRRCAPDGAGAVDAMLVNAAAVLLISPVSWSHHWVWLVPAMLTAGVALSARPVPRGLAAGTLVGSVVFVAAPHWLLPHRYGRERDWSWWQHLVGNAYLLTALLTLAILAWRRRPVSPLAAPAAALAPPSHTSTRTPRSAPPPADSVR